MTAPRSTGKVLDRLASTGGSRDGRWRLIRRGCGIAYFAVLIGYCVIVGIPEDRYGLLTWTVIGLVIRGLGRGWRSLLQILLDWLPFTAALVAYDYTRGIADNLGIHTHVTGPLHADLWMFHGTLPTYWIQQHIYHPGSPRWYDAAETLIYTSHFVATPVVAVILWIRNRRAWLAFIGRILALLVAGLATYILYPAAPPWYAARHGLTDPVVRISSRGWLYLHWQHAGTLVRAGQAGVNNVAAMPSLHTATATVIALFFIPRIRWWPGKILLGCYPILMGLTLVYSAEHYVVDLLFGYLYGILVTVGAVLVQRWWAGRRTTEGVSEGSAAA